MSAPGFPVVKPTGFHVASDNLDFCMFAEVKFFQMIRLNSCFVSVLAYKTLELP